MTQVDFDRVRDVFLAARDLDGAGRADVLVRECRADVGLRNEIESLLAHHDLQHARVTTPLAPGAALKAMLNAPPLDEDPLPRSFGGFELLEVVGRGGMGTVYRALQRTPERTVALKVIRPGMMSATMLERFRHETDMLARLQHPGIAQIFEAGEVQSPSGGARQPYFAMEFVSGRPIDVAANDGNLHVRQRIEMIGRVCDAVHHAHQKGVIHRDLKPANILVDAAGQPRILDFGVARATDADMRATMMQTSAGQLIGTLPYMSPEQVSGDSRRLDIRSDVYALGVLTFEILTGSLPYDLDEKTVADAALTLREAQPQRLSAISPALRGDLDTIIGKALEKDPARRYESAAALADDFRRYLASRPIVARPRSALYQIRLFSRRHRALVAGAALAAAALVVAAIVSVGFAWRSHRAAVRETKQRQIAERTNEYLMTMLTMPDPHKAGADLTVGDMLNLVVTRLDAQNEMPEVEAKVRTAIGTTYVNLRRPQDAAKQLTRAVDLWRVIEPRGVNLADALAPLGVARLHVGDLQGSEAAYREALDILSQFPDVPLQHVRAGLLDTLMRSYKYEQAAPIARDALADTRRSGDPASIVARLRQVARVEAGLNRHDSALESLSEALVLGERSLPQTHPLYYNVLLDISVERRALGDLAGALEASSQAYNITQRALKPGANDWTGCLMAHLASLGALDRRDEMVAVLTNARSALVAEYGSDHILVPQIDLHLKRLQTK